jgi:transcriptional regulator with XRE-family HTH domain
LNGETVLDRIGRTAAIAEDAKTESRGEEDATPLVNVTELGKHMRRKRQADHLSLRAVARATQVSASTLSRIENGSGIPDAETLARLARWLNFPLERIVGSARTPGGEPVVYYPHESTPDIVEAHLRADRNLTPETARALAELFRVAYQQFSPRGAKEDGEGGR